MAKKTKQNSAPPNYILPAGNKELQSFTENNKVSMMEQVVNSIEYAISNNLPLVEVFQFNKSDFVITISEQDYLTNLDNVYSYYLKEEIYEYCPRVISLQKSIKMRTGHIINNEK